MSGLYELKCENVTGEYSYYYFYSPRTIRNLSNATKSGYAPDAVRLEIADKDETPIEVRFMYNPFEYIFKKYFKRER